MYFIFLMVASNAKYSAAYSASAALNSVCSTVCRHASSPDTNYSRVSKSAHSTRGTSRDESENISPTP